MLPRPFFALAFGLTSLVAADIPSSITIATECKTCPYSLCPNKYIYGDSDNGARSHMNLTCWTEGTKIVDDTTWLRTNDSCYVNQYDLKEWSGDYTVDLPYCGHIAPKWTTEIGRTRYFSECKYTPNIDNTNIKMYKYNIDLELTCVAPNVTFAYGQSHVLGKNKWYKTKSNCYVHENTLWPVGDEESLDNCGPVYDRFYATDHSPEPTPTPTSTATAIPLPTLTASIWSKSSKSSKNSPVATSNLAPSAAPLAQRLAKSLQRRYLYTDTMGEEYVNCTANTAPSNRGRNIRVYQYNQTVTFQCGTMEGNDIMLFTTDFCWIKDDETWVQLTTDYYRSNYFPHCEHFVDERT